MRFMTRPALFAIPFFFFVHLASGATLTELTDQEANSGLKAALETGATAAVAKLGTENGFLNNDKVKIQLPDIVERAKPLLKMTGRGQQLDELVIAMNRAAESAIPAARPLLVNAVKSMNMVDAKTILTGGDTSVTMFFKDKTSAPLTVKFRPIVKAVTDRAGLSAQYNATMSQASKLGVVSEHEATVEGYVTQRALEGLYYMIGEEEKSIRRDPLSTGSKIIGKVFGSLR